MTEPDPGATPTPSPEATPSPDPALTPPAPPQDLPPSGVPGGWQPAPPDRRDERAPGLLLGIALVVLGAVFLIVQIADIALGPDAWPLWLVVPGLVMLTGSLFIPSRGGLGLGVPGAILAIIGGILWVQTVTGLWGTWAYAWALVAPTGPGVALLLHGAVHGDGDLAREGLRTTLTGIGLFLGFALFFEGVMGISGHRIEQLDQVLPYGAIGLGVLMVVLAVVDGGRDARRRERRRAEQAPR